MTDLLPEEARTGNMESHASSATLLNLKSGKIFNGVAGIRQDIGELREIVLPYEQRGSYPASSRCKDTDGSSLLRSNAAISVKICRCLLTHFKATSI